MKKVFFVVCVCLLAGMTVYAQNRSIEFLHPDEISWKKVLKKAKKEKKMIFMDCYTSWCGPCKRLAKEVFTLDSVADYYNKNFVCIKYDAEKDKDKGYSPNNPYGIPAFPTLLYMDNRGNVVHCMVGAYGDLVVSEARKAMDKERNLSALTRRFQAGEQETGFLKQYVDAMALANQPGKEQLAMDYLNRLTDQQFYTKETWKLIDKQVKDVLSPVFIKAEKNRNRFYSIVGKEAVDYKLMMALLSAESPFHHWKPGTTLDEARCRKLMDYLQTVDMERVPVYLAELAIVLDQSKGNYKGILTTLQNISRFGGWEHYQPMYMTDLLGRFVQCKDAEVIREGLAWIEDMVGNEYYTPYSRVILLKAKESLLQQLGDPEAVKEAAVRTARFAEKYHINLIKKD